MKKIPTLPNPGCVLNVGEGRGFILRYRMRLPEGSRQVGELRLKKIRERRVIVTAAHCLPRLPPADAIWNPSRTYKDLLGTLGGATNVWAECLFADPIADIAILGCPEDLVERANAFHDLIDDAPAVDIGPARSGRGWLLALDGHWFQTTLQVSPSISGISLWIGTAKPGMSGSPVLNDAGRAVSLVSVAMETVNNKRERKQEDDHGPQPILTCSLPGWIHCPAA